MSAVQHKSRDVFVTGLRNAHAMETQAHELLSRQIDRVENYPEISERLRSHLQETDMQRKRLEEVLAELNEHHSAMKDAAMGLIGNLAALGHSPAPDEILKNNMANLAFEHYEIAAYRSLITMADILGQKSALAAAEQSLKEEQAMGEWVEQHIAPTVTLYLRRVEAGEKADR